MAGWKKAVLMEERYRSAPARQPWSSYMYTAGLSNLYFKTKLFAWNWLSAC